MPEGDPMTDLARLRDNEARAKAGLLLALGHTNESVDAHDLLDIVERVSRRLSLAEMVGEDLGALANHFRRMNSAAGIEPRPGDRVDSGGVADLACKLLAEHRRATA